MPPKVLQKPAGDQASSGGVLPVPAAARAHVGAKQSTARLKLEIRRLPPSLTLTEFEEILGDDWKLGAGKVDWREYRQGKIKSPGKHPEQSRCYMHLLNEGLVTELEQRFLNIVFHDKAGTHKLNELKHLPPTIGFAPNQRVPLPGKQKADPRQGTIDQDPEFIAFLEAETQPIAKPAPVDVASAETEPKAKSTPLIEALRERKAAKAKAAAAKAEGRGPKQTEGKEAAVEIKPAPAVAATGKKGDKARAEQAARDAAKVATKQAAGKQAQNGMPALASPQRGNAPAGKNKRGAPPPSPKPATATPTVPASPAPARVPPPRQRGNAEGIKKMLQKDLGIKPKPTPPAQAAAPTPPSKDTPTAAAGAAAASTTKPTSSPTQQSPPPKAYLKHANPSQGMTEILIQRALSVFEAVPASMGNVTIDPRKGTAIAVFKTHEGLRKAIEAKKVPVAGGAVEVMKLKEFVPGGGGGPGNAGIGARGGFRGGRGGGARGGRGGSGIAGTMNGAGAVSARASQPASQSASQPAPIANA